MATRPTTLLTSTHHQPVATRPTTLLTSTHHQPVEWVENFTGLLPTYQLYPPIFIQVTAMEIVTSLVAMLGDDGMSCHVTCRFLSLDLCSILSSWTAAACHHWLGLVGQRSSLTFLLHALVVSFLWLESLVDE